MATAEVAPASADKKAKKAGSTPRKAKAASGSKTEPLHPSYLQMSSEAIVTLKERTGSSQFAIAKHIESKYKSVLPANFKKILSVQLRNAVKQNKLVKVKASYKLSEELKKQVAPKRARKAPGAVATKKVTTKAKSPKKAAPKKAKPAKKTAPKTVKPASTVKRAATAKKTAPARKPAPKKPAARKPAARSAPKTSAPAKSSAKAPAAKKAAKSSKAKVPVKSSRAKKPVAKRAKKA